MTKRLLTLSFLLLYNLLSFSQTTPDSLLSHELQQVFISRYYEGMKENAPLFNGAEYTGHGQGLVGHPFFQSEEAFGGWIEYDGVLYQNISMKYDMIDQTVIISDYTNNYFIKLNSKKIRSFSLDQFEFVQPALYDQQADGFFQVLSKGSVSLLAKKTKRLRYQTNVEKTVYSFAQFNKYYINKDGRYIPVGSRNDILKALKGRRADLRKFITDNKLNYKKNTEEFLIKTVAYYNQTKAEK